MKLSLEFKNQKAKVIIFPEDEWEEKLLGAVAKGGESLEAIVKYEPQGHYSYGKCKVVSIELNAK